MVRFLDLLSAEIIKTKRTRNFTLVILFPILVTTIVLGYYIYKLLGEESGDKSNIWVRFSSVFFLFYFFIYPLLAALITFSLSNIEHRNNGFKQLFTFPTSKFSIYSSKVLILFFWMFCSLLLAYFLLVLSGNGLSYLFPQAGFHDYNINRIIITFFLRTFLSLISIISIHFFLSIYWENFIVSVGSASLLVILGLALSNRE